MGDSSISHSTTTALPAEKVRLAVYDFDGTCITGNSPALLVGYLMRNRILPFPTALRIGIWALRYKYQLPQNESFVRGLVFKPFCGIPADLVDDYLRLFYDEVVAARWRPAADESIAAHHDEGCVVMAVSATWEPIAFRAQESHRFDHVIATRMVVDANGNYTRRVDGLPLEGQEKLRAVIAFANKAYGEGGWELAYAYGDHHSDAPLLSAATTAFAVTPNKPLARMARERGWRILEWE
ncbi:MAG: HAD-IB family phosphatase [Eggerthellaceae bacterium]|nr:HAD-IB family phosphatase [Eggerthellaceae bacterium]